jgi:hypothetical protein
VRLEVEVAPTEVNDCNCSLCRRYGVLWAYCRPGRPGEGAARLVQGEAETQAYVWGDKELAFHFCRHCGCLTHHTIIGAPEAGRIRGVNARMMPSLDPSTVTIQRSDNGHTGWFWTRPDLPIRKGPQPPFTFDPDDWRYA